MSNRRRAKRAPVEEIVERLDIQIQNQIASINRLLANGSYDDEMKALHEELAECKRKLRDTDTSPSRW